MERREISTLIRNGFVALQKDDRKSAQDIINMLQDETLESADQRSLLCVLVAKTESQTIEEKMVALERLTNNEPEDIFLLCCVGNECLMDNNIKQAKAYLGKAAELNLKHEGVVKLYARLRHIPGCNVNLPEIEKYLRERSLFEDEFQRVVQLRNKGRFDLAARCCINLCKYSGMPNIQTVSFLASMLKHLGEENKNRTKIFLERLINMLDLVSCKKLLPSIGHSDIERCVRMRIKDLSGKDVKKEDLCNVSQVEKLRMKGDAQRAAGKLEKALASYKKALELQPNNADSIQGMILISLDLYYIGKKIGKKAMSGDVAEFILPYVEKIQHPNQLVNLLRITEKLKYKKLRYALKNQVEKILLVDENKCLAFAKYYLGREKNRNYKMATIYLKRYGKKVGGSDSLYFKMAWLVCTKTFNINLAVRAYECAVRHRIKKEALRFYDFVMELKPELLPDSKTTPNVLWEETDVKRVPVNRMARIVTKVTRFE